MTVGDFLNNLAKATGISADNEALKSLLSSQSLITVEMPEDLAQSINKGLLTVESAKSNSDLTKHFRATILNGLDQRMTTLMDELELGDEVKTELKAVENSFERVAQMAKKVKELESAKASAKTGDKDKMQTEIDRLNNEIRQQREAAENLKKTYEDQIRGIHVSHSLDQVFNSFSYADNLPVDDYKTLARQKFDQTLREKGFSLQLDDSGSLKIVNSEGSDAFDDQNMKVNVKDLATRIVADNKYLKVSGTPSQGTPPAGTPPAGTPPEGNNSFLKHVSGLIESEK